MSRAQFLQALKSTLDKQGYDLAVAQAPDILYVDLDDPIQSTELFKGESSAIVLGSLVLHEDPRDPLYSFSFQMGARTVTDASNYSILSLSGQVNVLFEKGKRVSVYQYATVGAVGAVVGFMFITDVSVDDQMFERMSGIRLLTIQGKAVRFN